MRNEHPKPGDLIRLRVACGGHAARTIHEVLDIVDHGGYSDDPFQVAIEHSPGEIYVRAGNIEALELVDDPLYGPAVREAARVNRVGGLHRDPVPLDINVMAIAIANMAAEIERLRKGGAR